MKVVHVFKRIEMIDNDIKELKKLEKTVARNKSFSTPIYMSIEKQINILLGERIKLLELRIENPPENMVEQIEGKKEEREERIEEQPKAQKKSPKSASRKKPAKKQKKIDHETPDEEIPMLTQDQIDARFASATGENEKTEPKENEKQKSDTSSTGDDVKILDSALEQGSLAEEKGEKKTAEKDRKVRFFRENFPLDSY